MNNVFKPPLLFNIDTEYWLGGMIFVKLKVMYSNSILQARYIPYCGHCLRNVLNWISWAYSTLASARSCVLLHIPTPDHRELSEPRNYSDIERLSQCATDPATLLNLCPEFLTARRLFQRYYTWTTMPYIGQMPNANIAPDPTLLYCSVPYFHGASIVNNVTALLRTMLLFF